MLLKILALGYGLLCIALTFLVDLLGPGVLQASLAIFGIVGGPLLGLFTLGMISQKANIQGGMKQFISGHIDPKSGHSDFRSHYRFRNIFGLAFLDRLRLSETSASTFAHRHRRMPTAGFQVLFEKVL